MAKVDNIPLEHVQNYMRLQNLLNNIALPVLRITFTDNWKAKYHEEWITSEAQATDFVSDIGAILFKEAGKIQKNLLKTGDIQKWDVPLVIDAIKCFQKTTKCKAESSDRVKEQLKSFNSLKEVRNQLSHHGGLKIDNKLFETIWNSTSDALINLGVVQDVLDKAKIVSVQENKANSEEAEKLKSDGNLHVKNSNFKAAVSKYSEAIRQPGLPSNELAILHSNRSHAYLKLGDYYGAKDDAIAATLLNPNWWRGFGRLGHVYLSVEKYKQALENFEKAIKLDPDCKLQNERDLCRHMIAKLNRDEHLDPMSYSNLTFQMQGILLTDRTKPLGMCAEGHKYFLGNGVTQNYKKAAEWYTKAAALGNAEGYYNLALLTKEGKGVNLNVAESIRLIKLAASQDIYVDMLGMKMPNIGVVQAEHSLGLAYEEGIGVPQDFEKALEWYTRAIKHGSGVSANNVGIMYRQGSGVPLSLQTGLNYQKLGASMKVVRAMENVADVYLSLLDKENAKKWFQFAISKGSLSLQSKKQFFLALVGRELDEPIDVGRFELELMEEMKRGPLAHLIGKGLPLTAEETMAKMAKKLISGNKDIDCDSSVTTSRSSLGLTDPYRVAIITQHRAALRQLRNEKYEYTKGEGNLLPRPMVDLFTLKPIHFADMDPKKDHVYEGFAIKLTLIEDAITGKPSISQIAEDENGDAQRIFIYNFPQNKETQNSIGFGCKITVVNPYFRLAKDGRPMIRVDDISLMFLHSNTTNKRRCRYCGNESDSTVPCRQCKRSFYCSKVCLKKDLMDQSHKDVCLKRL